MALVIKDRVRQTSTTAGYGTITLSGSVTGFQDFTVIGTGNTTYYTIADQSGSNWEVGLGTYTAPNQLARTTVYESSNGNALVNFGSNIKDVFVTLPAEAVPTGGGSGTVTQVNTTGSVSGITLTGGPITTTGTVTLGGTLDLSAPPAIGGTTPNTITGTTITANANVYLPAVVNTGVTTGVIRMVDGGDGYDYINIWTDDGTSYYPVKFPGGVEITGSLTISGYYTGQSAFFIGDGTSQSGRISLRGYTSAADVTIQAAASTGAYTLTLPTSAGSNNQVLKTDGSGNLSWINLNAPSIYTTTSSQNSTSTTLANITGLTATLAANTTYCVDCFVTFQSAATTTGMNFGFTSPTGTVCMLEVVVPITNTAAASQLRTIFPNNSSTNTGNVLGTGVSTINSNHTARFSGIIKVGSTGGTFAAQYATEVSASAITIPAGSTMVIQQIS